MPNHTSMRCSLHALLSWLCFGGPLAAQVTGVVLDAGTMQPIAGAKVTLQGTVVHTLTAIDGSFTLPVTGAALKIVVGHKGYYNQGQVVTTPATGVLYTMASVTVGNDTNYQLLDPATCGICHPDQVQEWTGSPMSHADTNTWLYDVFDGTGTQGGAGGFVYVRDSVHAAAHPASDCAACHQPEPWVKQPFTALEPIGSLSPAAMHGVSCEVCHKIADVDPAQLNYPGIHPDAVTFNLPMAPVNQHQVVYGGLGDATYTMPGMMRPSYQPQLMAEVCGACHQDKNDPDGDGDFEEPNGVISEPTYYEWLASPYGDPSSASFRSCVDCHMPATNATTFCAVSPVQRTPGTIRSHRIEGTTAAFLENAAELRLQVVDLGFGLVAVADVENRHTGHHLPTGVTMRNMVLLVEAWDVETGARLPQIAGETLGPLAGTGGTHEAGYYEGLPGRVYAKINRSASGGAPTFFTEATSILADNRIAARATDTTSYLFANTSTSGRIAVRARLIYRRAWRDLVDAKQWITDGHGRPLEDIVAPVFGHLMEEQSWHSGAAPVTTYGSACGGLAIGAIGQPTSGASDFAVTLVGATASAPLLVWFGLSDSQAGSNPLPWSLAAWGAPGCSLLASPDAVHFVMASPQGDAAKSLAIPHPAMLGLELFAQWAAPAANPLGLIMSDGLALIVQR